MRNRWWALAGLAAVGLMAAAYGTTQAASPAGAGTTSASGGGGY